MTQNSPLAFVTVEDGPTGFKQVYHIFDEGLDYRLGNGDQFSEDQISDSIRLRGLILCLGLQVAGIFGNYSDVYITVGDKSWAFEAAPEGTALDRAVSACLDSENVDRRIQVAGEIFSGGLYLDRVGQESHNYLVDLYHNVAEVAAEV